MKPEHQRPLAFLATLALAAYAGRTQIDPKPNYDSAGPTKVFAAEITHTAFPSFTPPATEDPPMATITPFPETVTPEPTTIPTKEPEIKIYDLSVGDMYKNHASFEPAPDGKYGIILTRANPGDTAYSISPDALPPVVWPMNAREYEQSVNWLNVTDSLRYQAYNGVTHCDDFVKDWSWVVGHPIPYYFIDTKGGYYGDYVTIIDDWLQGKSLKMGLPWWDKEWGQGSDLGWVKVSPEQAVANAYNGIPTIAIKSDPYHDHSGHIAVVLPEKPRVLDGVTYPILAQAGSKVSEMIDARTAFDPWISGYVIHGRAVYPDYYSNPGPPYTFILNSRTPAK
jgi:hypothetical protein